MRNCLALCLSVFLFFAARAQQSPNSAYRFSYTIDTMQGKRGYIRVRFSLQNNSGETLCFLRRSCSPANELRWNDHHWRHSPAIVCRASFPVVDTVAAHSAYTWTTFFSGRPRDAVPEFTYLLLRLRQKLPHGTHPDAAHLPPHDTIPLNVPAGTKSPQDFIRAQAMPLGSPTRLSPAALASLDRYSVIMVGELHGTNEPVRFAAALAEAFAKRGDSVLFGFEIPEKELTGFLQQSTAEALAATPFFRGSTNDGRGNRAWYAALQQTLNNPRLQAFYFDPGSVPGRDSLMAVNIRAARAAHPGWKVITISGNLHNRRTGFAGERRAAGYLEQSEPALEGALATVNLSFGEASMRNNTGSGIELRSVDNSTSDFARATNFDTYLLFYPKGAFAYDAVLFVRKLTAADMMQ